MKRRVLVFNVLTGAVRTFLSPETASSNTEVGLAALKKYLKTPELGDWPTKGFYFRYEDQLDDYPWKPIESYFLKELNTKGTPSLLIHAGHDGGHTKVTTSVTKMANYLKITADDVRRHIASPHMNSRDISIMQIRNPRVKDRNVREINPALKHHFFGGLLNEALQVNGIHLDQLDHAEFRFIKSAGAKKVGMSDYFPYKEFSTYNHALQAAIEASKYFHSVMSVIKARPAYKHVMFTYEYPYLTLTAQTRAGLYKATIDYNKVRARTFVQALLYFVNAMDNPIAINTVNFDINNIINQGDRPRGGIK